MQVIRCDECSEVLVRVQQVDEKAKMAATVLIAKHATEQHIIPWLERYLEAATELQTEHHLSYDDLYDSMRVRCPYCKVTLHEDNYRYVRIGQSTQLCCSDRCLRLVMQ
jgi:phage FluMu protein Com